MKKTQKFLLALSTGILLTLSFPPMPFNFLAFVAFIPLLHLLNTTKKLHFWLIYLTFFVYHTGTLWWISSFQEKTDEYLFYSGFALDIFHPFFFFIPVIIWLIIRIKNNQSLSLTVFPFVWVSFEWLHAQTELSFPWLSVGYTQVYNTGWVQFADLTGVFGVSLLIVAVNVLIYKIIINVRLGLTKIKHNRRPLGAIIVLILVPIIYSNIQNNRFKHEKLIKKNETIDVLLVQPDTDPWEKWSKGPYDQIRMMQELSENYLDSGITDLVIWPETSIQYLNERINSQHDVFFLREWVRNNDITLMAGFVDLYYYDDDKPSTARMVQRGTDSLYYDRFNSAILINENSSDQIYRKMKLTPFAERTPHAEVFGFINDLVSWNVGISAWGKGFEQKNLYLNDSVSFAPIICIESIYPGFVKNFAAKGANFYTVITNDAWYDHTPGPEQHMLISAMRAIENKKYLARSALSGVTCFIAPNGEVYNRAPQYKKTALSDKVANLKGVTVYSVLGDWVAYLSLFITILFLFKAIIKK